MRVLSFLTLAGVILFLGRAPAADAPPKVKTQTLTYKQGETELESYLAFPVGEDGKPLPKRPGVLVFPEWTGVNEHATSRADELAKLGYVALVVDVYGKGVRPTNPKDAAATATIYKKDRALLRQRAAAGLEALRKQPQVDGTRVAAIGYCFGGLTALELARGGADLKGAVSFHGDLSTLNPDDAKKVKAKLLALHGAADPFVPPAQVAAFEDEMTKAGVDWQLVKYSGAVHSFTNPKADDYKAGVCYDAKADKRSWQAMRDFFDEVLGKP